MTVWVRITLRKKLHLTIAVLLAGVCMIMVYRRLSEVARRFGVNQSRHSSRNKIMHSSNTSFIDSRSISVSGNTSVTNNKQIAVIFDIGKEYEFLRNFDFSLCDYTACDITPINNFGDAKTADIVMFEFDRIKYYPDFDWRTRSRQYWVLYTSESPGYEFNSWKLMGVKDGVFNVTFTYRSHGPAVFSFGQTEKITHKRETNTKFENHLWYKIKMKKKAAYVYIADCRSVHYERAAVVQQLRKYINIDLFGECYQEKPCQRLDFGCEQRLHKSYRFYLSFENSLCTEYITEKFWGRLQSSAILVPVAFGGLSVDEYTSVAPPNSFIHAYNFSTIDALGRYLQHLMKHDEELIRYHYWRRDYRIRTDKRACDMCRLAHSTQHIDGIRNITDWWHSGTCKSLPEIRQKRQ